MKMIKKIKQDKKSSLLRVTSYELHDCGFSIVGVLVAVFISSVGMAAILNLVTSSFNGAQVGKMRLIASGLAQEGIEIVRNDRRANSVGGEWNNWYASVSSGDYVTEVKASDKSIVVTPL
ncbi:MAG: hypothetical protein K9M15_01245, partial [Candidatus Marinimicrobia bacterium]|nr:hypothetical protein [Candidatus Neomarinimicrobiota bacterium]